MVTDLAILLAAFGGTKLVGVVRRRRALRRGRLTKASSKARDLRSQTIIDEPDR